MTKNISITVDDATHATLTRIAKGEDRTLSAQCFRVLRTWCIDREGSIHAPQSGTEQALDGDVMP